MSALLAHQGGWDEVLLVLGPILLIAGLLVLAKRRVEASAALHRAGHHEPAPSAPDLPDEPDRPAPPRA